MSLKLTSAHFTTIGEPEDVLHTVRNALQSVGYSWKATGSVSATASKADASSAGEQPRGSAKTQIEIVLDGPILRTRRISRGNHKGFVGVVQVQQDHRRAAKAVERALLEAGLLSD
ncbi:MULTISPECIES: hypothetical protein [unclassified Brevibacterium]|uniref:hypothetical protein n=1 Tax=unclassified Brevibacterium TaxID=2614124 RepID=UPI000C38959E|nr:MULTISPECIES: hypothetical protein [unclassified Brevibacterium]SMX92493.1 hypothetical protein BSP239C_02389 [Brevibacterium sp. 239c]